MGKKSIDPDYIKVQKQYAALLVKVNPKGTDEELAALKERIEARRWGQKPAPIINNCPIYNEMYKVEIQAEREEFKRKWQALSAEKTILATWVSAEEVEAEKK